MPQHVIIQYQPLAEPVFTPTSSPPEHTISTWLPSYPDFARGKRPLVQEGWITREHLALSNFPIPELSWLSSYPDFARRLILPILGGEFRTEVVTAAVVPELSWLGKYPDIIRLNKRPLVQEGWVTNEHLALPNFPIPVLSWGPSYPDFARKLFLPIAAIASSGEFRTELEIVVPTAATIFSPAPPSVIGRYRVVSY